MKSKLFQNKLYVKKSPIHGYGVFAEAIINEGEIVEESYAILTRLKDPSLLNYVFKIDDEKRAMLTGFASLYNHAEQPNVKYSIDRQHNIVTFTAKQTIQPDEEVFISYGKDWFSERSMVIKKLPLWRKLLFKEYAFLWRVLLVGVATYLLYIVFTNTPLFIFLITLKKYIF